MSIYATLWRLKFPRDSEDYIGCEWIEVIAQGVPAHIGSPTPGCGYEDGDPYGEFLPPPLLTAEEGEHEHMRAVVFVTEDRVKGTARHPQEYVNPLLVLDGEEYERISFEALHDRICDALRGERPRLVAHLLGPGGSKLLYEDGTSRVNEVTSETEGRAKGRGVP